MTVNGSGRVIICDMSKTDLIYPVRVGALHRAMHEFAEATGQARPQDNSERSGPSEPWDTVESACAEAATAQYLGLPWPGDWWSKTKTIDIPPDIEVRWTKYRSGHLIFYPQDEPHFHYVLVAGAIPRFLLLGWLYGHEGLNEKNRKVLRLGRPAQLAVSQNALRPMSELLRIVNGEDV